MPAKGQKMTDEQRAKLRQKRLERAALERQFNGVGEGNAPAPKPGGDWQPTAELTTPDERKLYHPQQFIDAIPGTWGILSRIADKVDCGILTVQRFINDYPHVKEAWLQEKHRVDDDVEHRLIEQARDGDKTLSMFYARTKLASRGYQEQLKIDIIPSHIQTRLAALCARRGVTIEALLDALLTSLEEAPPDVIQGLPIAGNYAEQEADEVGVS